MPRTTAWLKIRSTVVRCWEIRRKSLLSRSIWCRRRAPEAVGITNFDKTQSAKKADHEKRGGGHISRDNGDEKRGRGFKAATFFATCVTLNVVGVTNFVAAIIRCKTLFNDFRSLPF
jgi:hypothetical protein